MLINEKEITGEVGELHGAFIIDENQILVNSYHHLLLFDFDLVKLKELRQDAINDRLEWFSLWFSSYKNWLLSAEVIINEEKKDFNPKGLPNSYEWSKSKGKDWWLAKFSVEVDSKELKCQIDNQNSIMLFNV